MANEFKVKKGLIVHGSGSTVLDIQGSQGQLFSVTDQLTGTLFSVSDISGIPILEVDSDDSIRMGTFGSEAIIISGSSATISGSFSGSFQGDGSNLANITASSFTETDTLDSVTDRGATTTNNITVGTIGSGAITSTGKISGTELEGTSLDINGNADISGDLVITGNIKNNIENGSLDLYGGADATNDAHIKLYGNNSQWASIVMDHGYDATNSKFIVNQGGTERFKIQNNVAYFSGTIQGAGITVTGTASATTFLGDLSGSINTLTTAVTKPDATNDTTVATTAFVQNLIGTIPAGLVFQGTWNAATNTPTLADGTGTTGHFYIVSTDGSTNLDGITDWKVGDWAVFVEQGATDAWEKVDNSSVLDGSGTGNQITKWAGSGTSNTLTDSIITDNGTNVGIGTLSPSTRLEVVASATTSVDIAHFSNSNDVVKIKHALDGGGSGITSIFDASNNEDIRLSAGSNSWFNAGNVGIGTGNPLAKLDVRTANGNTSSLRLGRIDNSSYWDFNHAGADLRIYNTDGAGSNILFGLDPSGTAYDNKVGIGTATPNAELHIEGSSEPGIRLTETGGTNYYDLKTDGSIGWFGDRANNEKNLVVTAGGGAEIRTNGDLVAVKVENQAPAGSLYIKNTTGNVGIGTTSPTVPLEISSDSTVVLKVNNSSNSSAQIVSGNNYLHIGSAGYIVANNPILAYNGLWFLNNQFIRTTEADGTWTDMLGLDSNNILKIGTMSTVSTAGHIALYTNGSEKMRIERDGNVGIGTTSPGYKLDVVGDGIRAIRSTAGWAGWFENTESSSGVIVTAGVDSSDAPLLIRKQDGTELFSVRGNGTSFFTNGNVGIGTTSPSARLEVSSTTGWGLFTERGIKDGSTSTYSHNYGAGNAHILGRSTIFESSVTFSTSTASSTTKEYRLINQSDKLVIASVVAGATTDNNILVVSGTNVGIGTASPSQRLDVAGNAALSTGGYIYGDTTNPYIRLNNAGGAVLGYGTSQLINGGSLQFQSTSGVLFRINSSGGGYVVGNFGIGTTSPARKLDVAGDLGIASSVNALRIGGNGVLGVLNGLTRLSGTGGASGGIMFTPNNDNTERMRITSAGNVGIGTTSPSAGLQVALGSTTIPAAGASTASAVFGNSTSDNNYGVAIGANSSGIGYISSQRTDGTATTYNLAIQSNGGFVGVGTDSPDGILHLKSANPNLILEDTSNPNKNKIENVDGNMRYHADYDSQMGNSRHIFFIDNSEKLRIDTNGNVGIGTTNPTAKLHVVGDGLVTGELTFKPKAYSNTDDLNNDNRGIFSTHAVNNTTSNRATVYSSVYTLGGSASNALQISTNEDYNESGMFIRQYNQNPASPQGAGWQNWTEVWTTNHAPLSKITNWDTAYTYSQVGHLPLAGGTMTGTNGVLIPDNFKLKFGDATTPDLQIYHDGSNSYIDEVGIGSLYNRTTLFIVQNTDSTKNSIIGNPAADVKLYYNGVKKLETTNTGITVTGNIELPTTNYIKFIPAASLSDAIIYYGNTAGTNGTIAFKRNSDSSTMFKVTGSGNAEITGKGTSSATITSDGSSTLTTKGYVDSLITGATIYRGAWDPSGGGYGSPNLSTVTQTSGYYYICSATGTAEPNGTGTEPDSWAVGDWVIYNDVSGTGQWQKIDNSSVLSGAGTGQTVALWEGANSITDSETLGNAPITVSGNNTTFAGNVTTSGNSLHLSSRKFIARDGNGTGLFAANASSGLSIADNGNATFTGTATASSFVSSTDSGISINGITMTKVAANSAIRVSDGLETLGLLRSYSNLIVATTGTFGGNVTVSGGTVTLGSDVSIFRDGTNILRTDDKLHANNDIYVGGAGKIFDRANNNNYIELADTIIVSTAATFAGTLAVQGTGDSYFTGNVGIGNTNPVAAVDIVKTSLPTTGDSYGVLLDMEKSSSTTAYSVNAYGLRSYTKSTNTGTNQITNLNALWTKAEHTGTGPTYYIIGSSNRGYHNGSGNTGAIYGAFNEAKVLGTGTGTHPYVIGANIASELTNANATITNLQGSHISVKQSAGTVTGTQVLLLDYDMTGGSITGDLAYLRIQNDTITTTVGGTARAIHSLSTLPSEFAGLIQSPTFNIGSVSSYLKINSGDVEFYSEAGLTIESADGIIIEISDVMDISGGDVSIDGSITATSFVKSGGTSAQFLKADGSVDSNTYLISATPNAPTNLVTSIVNDTINVTFTASTTSNIDNYLVFSSVAGGDYGLISIIPPADFSATMSIIDDSFDAGGTQAYRVYAVKSGMYSSPLTGNLTFTVGTVEPTNMSVINFISAYYIQYNAPSSKGRFVTAYNIYKDEQAVQGNLTRAAATLIYSGMNNSYMYQISGNSNNNYHQFWVETTVV